VTENHGGPSDSSQDPDDPFDIVLDEDFVRAATTKEPSARARELGARWSEQPPEATGWRGDTPDPSRQADPWADQDRPARRGQRLWVRNLVLVLAVASVVGYLVYPRHGRAPLTGASPTGTAQPGVGATGPTPSPSFTNPDDQYFADSPALSWADNDAGIVPPTAAAMGSFPALEIADGYEGLRRLLIAGNLDPAILAGGPVTGFTRLLDSRSHLPEDLNKWISHPGLGANAIDVVTRFNPTTTRLLGNTVKVQGGMTAGIDKNGALTVTGDYRFVYAVGPGNGPGRPSRAVVHRVYVLELTTPGVFESQPERFFISNYASDIANTACNTYNGYINPAFGVGGGSSGRPVDPYASTNLLSESASPSPTGTSSAPCGTASRL
jgi:hypothetical protein